MRNRAKCKLCQDIIESLSQHDFVSCSCGEISIDGGTAYYRVSVKDFKNFLRVDDEGNEIVVIFDDKEEFMPPEPTEKTSKQELMDIVDSMIDDIERLPDHAKSHHMTQYDSAALLMLMKRFLEIM